MKRMVRGLSICSLLAIELIASTGNCAIPRSLYNRSWYFSFVRTMDFSKGLNIALIQPIRSVNSTDTSDIQKVIPQNMNPSSDTGYVASQILDHSLSSFFNSDAVKRSEIGRTAHQVEKTMEGNVAFGGTEPESIQHSLKFAMKAAQAKAQIEYSGLTNAQLSYQVSGSTLDLEVREPIAALGTQLVYNHINKPGDSADVLSVRWLW